MGAGVAESQLETRLVYSCLSVVVKGAQSPNLPGTRGQLYEALLELLYQLAAAPLTSDATLALLERLRLVPTQLDTVLSGLLAEGVRSDIPSILLYPPLRVTQEDERPCGTKLELLCEQCCM
jgi:hypothetical protein